MGATFKNLRESVLETHEEMQRAMAALNSDIKAGEERSMDLFKARTDHYDLTIKELDTLHRLDSDCKRGQEAVQKAGALVEDLEDEMQPHRCCITHCGKRDKLWFQLACGDKHFMHITCFDAWADYQIQTTNRLHCPMCRKLITRTGNTLLCFDE
jgi:hypothetical protein